MNFSGINHLPELEILFATNNFPSKRGLLDISNISSFCRKLRILSIIQRDNLEPLRDCKNLVELSVYTSRYGNEKVDLSPGCGNFYFEENLHKRQVS